MTKKKQIEPAPMTLGKALHICSLNEKAAIIALPYKVRVAFPGIALAGTQISFSPDGDFLTHEEAVEAVRLLLNLLTQDITCNSKT